jgi:hypothetical protein
MLKINPIRTPCDALRAVSSLFGRVTFAIQFALSVQIRHFRVVTPYRWPQIWGRLREGAESYAKLAQIAGARSYLLLPSAVAPERRRLSLSGDGYAFEGVWPNAPILNEAERTPKSPAASFASSTANRICGTSRSGPAFDRRVN